MRSLHNEGVKTIFGYPGGSIMPVFDALYGYTRGEKKMFDHILVRHEQAAAHATPESAAKWVLLSLLVVLEQLIRSPVLRMP